MDKRFEIRCTDEELARWRVAAGGVPLSKWVRGVLNGNGVVQTVGMRAAVERSRSDGSAVRPGEVGYEFATQHVVPVFKPDFGSRLKEK
jgi:hypothetical protein